MKYHIIIISLCSNWYSAINECQLSRKTVYTKPPSLQMMMRYNGSRREVNFIITIFPEILANGLYEPTSANARVAE